MWLVKNALLNILFAFATNTSGLKVASLDNTTEASKPVVKIFVEDTSAAEPVQMMYIAPEIYQEDTNTDTAAQQPEISPEHNYGSSVAQTDATCTADGIMTHYQCSECLKYFVDENGVMVEKTAEELKIAALGHTEETVAGIALTCTDAGLTEGKHCTAYGELTVQPVVADETDDEENVNPEDENQENVLSETQN